MRSDQEVSKAIHAAKEVFWRKGYEETSVADLVRATGMNRYALYNEFGGKLDIFLEALDAYYFERKNIFLDNLADPDLPPIEAIKRVFEFAITEMAERGAGCLMSNVASDIAAHEKIIHEKITSYLAQIKSSYEGALTRAEIRGELNPSVTPKQGAELFITLMLGIGTQAKHGASLEEMMASFEAGLAATQAANLQ